MGIGLPNLLRIVQVARLGLLVPGGAVAELGAQQLRRTAIRQGAYLAELAERVGAREAFPRQDGEEDPPAEDFWRWLGFTYLAIDIDGSPGSLVLDLNYDNVPPRYLGGHHLVTNFGTTEHVTNQLNAFKVVHDLASLGGVMVHSVPIQGHFNHGLINYNPKFFWMLARSNGYKWLDITYSRRGKPEGLPQNVVDDAKASQPEIDQTFKGYSTDDCGIHVIFQKVRDTPFIAPIDVNTGARTTDARLEERYWTVFNPGAFE